MPNRAKLTTRGISTSTVSTDTLPKNAALSNNELDSNFLNLRDQSFSIVGDDSTGIDIKSGDTIKLTGAGGATVTAVGDTITITTGGGSSIGDLSVIGSTISAPSNANLKLTSSGTGAVEIHDADFMISDAGAENEGQGEIARIGASQVDFNHNGNQTSTFSIYGGNGQTSGAVIPFQVNMLEQAEVRINNMLFPATTGSNGQVLTTNGSYVLSWQNPTGNLTINNLTISSSSNQSISILPDGTGNIILDIHTWPNVDGSNGQVLTTNGAGVLSWTTVSGGSGSTGDLVITGTTISAGTTNADITLTSSGTGNLNVDMDTLRIGDSNANATITTNGTGDLILNTNAGSSSGSITIEDAANGIISIQPNGTGHVSLGYGDLKANIAGSNQLVNANINVDHGANRTWVQTHDQSAVSANTQRIFANNDLLSVQLTGTTGTNSNNRLRQTTTLELDLNGINWGYDQTGYKSSIVGNQGAVNIINKNAAAATITQAQAVNGYMSVGDNGNLGDVTITDAIASGVTVDLVAPSGRTTTATNGYGVYSFLTSSGSGTKSMTNWYALFAADTSATVTNKYGLYIANDDHQSRLGTIERYKEKQNALTSSSTITVDVNLAPVHTVTLGINTQFGIANLATGETVTLIIRQDGTGSRTATFTSDTSAAVKFAGGVSTLSTAASAIDVVTIYNDGTNFLGNIAKAFA